MSKYDEEIKRIVTKAKLLNSEIEEIEGVFIISLSDSEHMLLIPSKITNAFKCNRYLRKLRGNIKVIGGEGLESANNLFSYTIFNVIDFSKFDTSHVTSMHHMF